MKLLSLLLGLAVPVWAIVVGLALLGHASAWWGLTASVITLLMLCVYGALSTDNNDH